MKHNRSVLLRTPMQRCSTVPAIFSAPETPSAALPSILVTPYSGQHKHHFNYGNLTSESEQSERSGSRVDSLQGTPARKRNQLTTALPDPDIETTDSQLAQLRRIPSLAEDFNEKMQLGIYGDAVYLLCDADADVPSDFPIKRRPANDPAAQKERSMFLDMFGIIGDVFDEESRASG